MTVETTEVSVIRTVAGDIEPERLGVTSSHEHLICDLSSPDRSDLQQNSRLSDGGVFALETLYDVRENHLQFVENLQLTDVSLAVSELEHFRRAGGASIIDVTSEGLGRNPEQVLQISRRAGVNVVLGSGYYVETHHPSTVQSMEPESIAAEIISDICHGIRGSSVCAGVIGEIGCSWPVSDAEERVLAAAAIANKATDAAIVVHPGRDPKAPDSHLSFLVSRGVAPSRVTIAHVDRRLANLDEMTSLAETGCYLSFDCFGLEPWIDSRTRAMPMPSDLQRIAAIERLFVDGYGDQILLGCDIAMKHRLRSFGGHGYDFLLRWVVPAMLARSELSEREIELMLVENPKRAYAFVPRDNSHTNPESRSSVK